MIKKIKKQLIDADMVWWLPELKGGEGGKGERIYGDEKNLTWCGGHTVQYTNNVL